MIWYFWLALGIAAIAGEALTLSLVLASVALAALSTAIIASATPLTVQIAVFLVLAFVLLVAVRPLALRAMPLPGAGQAQPRIGPGSAPGVATERIDHRRGQIRVGRSEFFSARTVAPDLVIEPEREVEIVGMDGLTALVRPAQPRRHSMAPGTAPFGLSPREVEVLQLMIDGLTNQEIADSLFLSTRTVHHHVSHIFAKMGVDSRVDATRLALQHGLEAPPEMQ